MRRPYVYYVARLSYAPLCTPGAESGTGQNNVTARAVTRGCKRRKTGSPSPSWGAIHRIPYSVLSGPPVVAPERRMTMPPPHVLAVRVNDLRFTSYVLVVLAIPRMRLTTGARAAAGRLLTLLHSPGWRDVG